MNKVVSVVLNLEERSAKRWDEVGTVYARNICTLMKKFVILYRFSRLDMVTLTLMLSYREFPLERTYFPDTLSFSIIVCSRYL